MRYAQTEVEAHRTPIMVTMEDYEREWKPKGWKLIIIGPTATWREDWGEWEAIRDIVQNCLDETEAYTYGYDHQGLWIADKGRGVAVADFLLGPPKLKPEWARGKYGEGMKIASLALLRLGHSVHVQTIRRELWVVFAEQVVNGRVKTLAALWKPDGTRSGTRFHIIGYRGSAFPQRIAVNVPPSALLFKAASDVTQPKQRYNQLFRSDMIQRELGEEAYDTGFIYCRDLFFRTIKSPFSYNLWGFKLAPDRHGPQYEGDLWYDAGRLWAMCTRVPLIAECLRMIVIPPVKITDETGNLSFDMLGTDPITKKRRYDIMKENGALWRRAWENVFGKGVVLETNEALRPMVEHLGYASKGTRWGLENVLREVLQTDVELVQRMGQRLRETRIVPDSALTGVQLNNLNLARAVARTIPGTGPVNAARIPPASERVTRTAGTYQFGPAIINIDVSQLNYATNTIGTMVHELAHHFAYQKLHDKEAAGDLTEAHANAMETIAGFIVRDVARGKFDEYLKATPIW